MKNSMIHSGLKDSGLRDFLAISMVKSCVQELENKQPIVPYRPNVENAFEYAIKDCENEITFQTKRLQLLREKQSIITLIKMQGWEEFDVSDETINDTEYYYLSMNFIGTRAEYDELISRISAEQQ